MKFGSFEIYGYDGLKNSSDIFFRLDAKPLPATYSYNEEVKVNKIQEAQDNNFCV